MATGSSVYAVKAAIVSLLTAQSQAGEPLENVQISHGYPGEGNIKRECIYVDRVTGGHRIPVFKGGRLTREETYSVTVAVFVQKDGSTVPTVEARAFTLLQEVEDILADDATLGGVSGVIKATAGEIREQADYGKTGAACLIEFDIDVLARLS